MFRTQVQMVTKSINGEEVPCLLTITPLEDVEGIAEAKHTKTKKGKDLVVLGEVGDQYRGEELSVIGLSGFFLKASIYMHLDKAEQEVKPAGSTVDLFSTQGGVEPVKAEEGPKVITGGKKA